MDQGERKGICATKRRWTTAALGGRASAAEEPGSAKPPNSGLGRLYLASNFPRRSSGRPRRDRRTPPPLRPYLATQATSPGSAEPLKSGMGLCAPASQRGHHQPCRLHLPSSLPWRSSGRPRRGTLFPTAPTYVAGQATPAPYILGRLQLLWTKLAA